MSAAKTAPGMRPSSRAGRRGPAWRSTRMLHTSPSASAYRRKRRVPAPSSRSPPGSLGAFSIRSFVGKSRDRRGVAQPGHEEGQARRKVDSARKAALGCRFREPRPHRPDAPARPGLLPADAAGDPAFPPAPRHPTDRGAPAWRVGRDQDAYGVARRPQSGTRSRPPERTGGRRLAPFLPWGLGDARPDARGAPAGAGGDAAEDAGWRYASSPGRGSSGGCAVSRAPLGVVGGSGRYAMSGLAAVREKVVSTPFGSPSDAYLTGRLGGREVAFLARHARGHRIMPGEINFRANICGFKMLGVERLVSVSAVGSMKEEHRPLDVVLPDKIIDRTHARVSTFFGGGVVAHVSLADPICAELRGIVARAARATGGRLHDGGTYLCIEGPQFSSRAESSLYRSWGVDVIGMTNAQEAKLAREAEICYATMAMVTDYDCWHEEEADVTVEEVVARLHDNAAHAQAILARTLEQVPETRACPCAGALGNAILTDRGAITPEMRARLRPVAGRYLD